MLEEGTIQAGDEIVREFENLAAPSVDQTHRLYFLDRDNAELLSLAAGCEQLAGVWRAEFVRRLEAVTSHGRARG